MSVVHVLQLKHTPSSYEYPHSSVTFPSVPTPTGSTGRCLGKEYTVQVGDSCRSIADANSLAIDRFLSDNSIDVRCQTLVVGAPVCIGDSCTLHAVAKSEACKDILAGKSFTITELLAWNPVIHGDCGNLDALEGHTICISPPGSRAWNVSITTSINNTDCSNRRLGKPPISDRRSDQYTLRPLRLRKHSNRQGDGESYRRGRTRRERYRLSSDRRRYRERVFNGTSCQRTVRTWWSCIARRI